MPPVTTISLKVEGDYSHDGFLSFQPERLAGPNFNEPERVALQTYFKTKEATNALRQILDCEGCMAKLGKSYLPDTDQATTSAELGLTSVSPHAFCQFLFQICRHLEGPPPANPNCVGNKFDFTVTLPINEPK